jgi:hypothetical protein
MTPEQHIDAMYVAATNADWPKCEKHRDTAKEQLAACQEQLKQAREALAIRKAYMNCPICENYIGDGFDHEATCKYHKAECDLPNSRQLARAEPPRTAGEPPVPASEVYVHHGVCAPNVAQEKPRTAGEQQVEREKAREWPCEHVKADCTGRWFVEQTRHNQIWVNKKWTCCPICGAVRPAPADSGKSVDAAKETQP